MGPFVTLDILVETEEQLFQIGHQLVKHLDNWKMEKGISSEPPTYSIYQEFNTEINNYLKEIDSILIKVDQDMTWEEAQVYDLNDIRKRIRYYSGILRSQNIPKKFHDDSTNLRISLGDLEKRIQEDQFFGPILERELLSYQSFIEEKTEYYNNSLENLTFEGLSSLSKQINDIEAEFRDFWN